MKTTFTVRNINIWVLNFIAPAILTCICLAMYSWALGPNMYFYVDDWGWLTRAVFTKWPDYLKWDTFLPAALFMDRPLEQVSIHLLYSFFELNHLGYGIAVLSIHILNCILTYMIGEKVFGDRIYALIAAALFSINVYISYPVWWVATIADSLALMFCLLSFLFSILNKKSFLILACVFYYLATRAKEASLPFPAIVLLWNILFFTPNNLRFFDLDRIKLILQKIWPILLLCGFLGSFYLYYFFKAKLSNQDFGAYIPSFTLYTVVDALGYYLRLLSYELLNGKKVLFALLILFIFGAILKNKRMIFFGGAFLIAASPVLVLGIQRVPYYAYISAPWFYLFVASFLTAWPKFLKLSPIVRTLSNTLLISLVFLLALYVYKTENISKPTITLMIENKVSAENLVRALPKLAESTNMVILGVPSGPLSFFAYAPCHAVQVIYKVKKLQCLIQEDEKKLNATYEDMQSPKILINFNRGEIKILSQEGL